MLLGAAAGVVFLLLILIYRSPLFWSIPLFTVLITETSARGAGYLLASAGLTISSASSGILSVLVFGAATDYALLLVARYREELRAHEDGHAAMRAALRGAAPAILASGGTVVLGLLTLTVSEITDTAALGPLGAAGVALAVVFSLKVLPATLLVAGRRAFWPFVPRPGSAASVQRGGWARLGAAIARRPRRVWTGVSLLLAVLALGLLELDTSLSGDQQFTRTVEAVTGQQLLARSFPAGTSAPAQVIVGDRDAVPAVRSALERARRTVASVGRAELGPAGAQLPVVLRADPLSRAGADAVPELRRVVRRAAPGALVGGDSAQAYDRRASAARDNRLIAPLTLLVVLIVLVALLRSLAAPVLLLATVVGSFAAALGVGVFVSRHVLGFAALDPTLPLLAFVFLVALGIDYNIFLMARAREEAQRLGTRPGILAALAVTGGVITSAGVVLAATFAVLAVLPLVTLAQLGFVVGFGVLLDTLLVRSILVPALVHDLGARVWWPSRSEGADGPRSFKPPVAGMLAGEHRN